MSRLVANPGLHRFALLTALATLALIGVGGLVTSHGVGMAVPDWPTTYGYNMFLFPISKMVGGILYEHSHRLVASGVGFLTTILALWLWVQETRGRARWAGVVAMALVIFLMGVRQMPVFLLLAALALITIGVGFYYFNRDRTALRWLGVVAFAAVILQGVLGGVRVTAMKDEIGIFHGALAQMFFVLVCTIALFTSRWWKENAAVGAEAGVPSGLRRLITVVTAAILLQLALGATMRHQHAGLAVPDFPLAYGKVWPATDAASMEAINRERMDVRDFKSITVPQIYLHMTHRIMALLIVLAVISIAWTVCRQLGFKSLLSKLSLAWLSLIVAQAMLGAATVWSNKAADVATLHVVVGALSLLTGTVVTLVCFRLARNPAPARAPVDTRQTLPPAGRAVGTV